MNKLNVFAGPRYREGDENRLTWALMTLLRLVPLACAAFVDLVRARQENPIPAFTAMSGCRTHIETQIGHLQARAGRLVAVGITREGGDVPVAIEAKPRKAIYDGLITFAPPDRDHSAINTREPVTLTVESKLDSLGGSWQLMPSEGHLASPEEKTGEPPLRVDPEAVVLAWRDVFRSLTDLEARNLLNSSERVLVRDFLEYVRSRHPSLNPFDRFAFCGGDIGLLNRRCEEVLRELEPRVAWTRTRPSRPFIGIESAAFQRIILYAEVEKNGQLMIRMGIWPGDTMNQARAFWPKVDSARLKELANSGGWKVRPNLHVSDSWGKHLHWARSGLKTHAYIDYWKNPNTKLRRLDRDSAGFRGQWERLHKERLVSANDVEELDRKTTSRSRISMAPGIAIQYTWPLPKVEELEARDMFAADLKERIRSATSVWDDVPAFCRDAQTG